MSTSTSKTPSTNLRFPSDVFKWMKKNAKSRNAFILMTSCKYFQDIKLSLTVIKDITPRINNECGYRNSSGDYQITNYRNLPKNLLLTEKIWLEQCSASNLLKNTWGCQLKEIHCNDQLLLYEQFKHLTFGSSVEQCVMINTKIKIKNGTPLPLDHILKCLRSAKKIYISGYILLEHVAENLEFSKLKELTLWEIPQNFNIEEFTNLMLINQKVKYYLVFGHSLNQEYIQKIQKCFDKIVSSWEVKYNPPQIIFPCQTEASKKAMRKLRKKYLKRIMRNV